MKVLERQIQRGKLRDLIAKVDRFPIDEQRLVQIAKKNGFAQEVIDFYESFPDDAVFSDKEDLLARSEQVGLLNSEDQPFEEFHAPEED